MNALTFGGVRRIVHERVPDAGLVYDTDAIVRVERAGLCGSDLHVYHGRELPDAGTILGHELLGRVVETGSAARRHTPGKRVVAPFSTCCGHCFYCERGLSARCEKGELFGWVRAGMGLPGAQAEYVRVPFADATLLAVDDDMPADLAILLADVLPTGWHAARLAAIAPGDAVVVLGCGPVGLAAVVAAREQAAGRVFAVDAIPERLALAASFGAEPLPLGGDLATPIREATSGRGADAALEIVGSPEATRLAFELIRPGGTVAIAGVHHERHFAFSPAEAYDKNLTLRIGRCPARSLMEELLPILRRRPELGSIVTHHRPLADGPAAYRLFDLKQDGCIKLVFEPRGGENEVPLTG